MYLNIFKSNGVLEHSMVFPWMDRWTHAMQNNEKKNPNWTMTTWNISIIVILSTFWQILFFYFLNVMLSSDCLLIAVTAICKQSEISWKNSKQMQKIPRDIWTTRFWKTQGKYHSNPVHTEFSLKRANKLLLCLPGGCLIDKGGKIPLHQWIP